MSEQVITFRRIRGRIVPIRGKEGGNQKPRRAYEKRTTEVAVRGAFGSLIGAAYGLLIHNISDVYKATRRLTAKPPPKPSQLKVDISKVKPAPGIYDLAQFRKQAEQVAKQNRRALTIFQQRRRAFINITMKKTPVGSWTSKRSIVLGAAIGAGLYAFSTRKKPVSK